MINTIRLRNFKSLKDVSLHLRNLNIVTGMNGVGKSSLIQSLLLIRQAYLNNVYSEGIVLDGELTGNLGTVKDILNVSSEAKEIEISINQSRCVFKINNKQDDTLLRGKCDLLHLKKSPLLSTDRFQYISASRMSPGAEYRKNTFYLENKQFGKAGQNVVPYLAEFGRVSSEKKRDRKYQPLVNMSFDEKQNNLPLESQVNYWLNFVSTDVRLDIKKGNNSKYDLNFEFYNGTSWDSFSSENSAFGLTYSLPVITALLAASPEDLIIIENPESDLHPQAQSKLGELIARCANNGAQIIIETHSDHILNGIRIAISSNPSLLPPEMTKVFYFHRETNTLNTTIEDVSIDGKGKLSLKNLKERSIGGFFDQLDKDYLTLLQNQVNQ